jgi:hypothetical protein
MKRKHKFGAKRTVVDGISFASKLEANRYSQLRLLERAGVIRELRLQVPYKLVLPTKYVADFVYVDNTDGVEIVEDAKGFRTPEYRRKKKAMREQHGVEIREVD